MSSENVVRVRFAPGVVGETKRVVHVAIAMPTGAYFTVCETTIDVDDAEILDGLGGMPCMACVRIMSLRSRAAEVAARGDPAELGAATRPETAR